MEIRGYTKGDELAIIALFEITFKQKMSLEQWNWRFTNNPAGKHWIKLMWQEGQLIGHYAVSPLIMEINGKEVMTAHSLATMTHPEHGGKGIFKALSNALYDDLEKNLGCKAIWGFPNNNSHYGFVNSLDWKDIGVIHTLGMAFHNAQHQTSDVIIEEFENFSSAHVAFIDKNIHSYPIKVKRSTAYLNWRYTEKPAVKYKKFFGQIEGINYLAVTKIYPTGKPEIWDLNIVELYVDDHKIVNQLIAAIGKVYSLNFDRVITWKNLHNKEHIQLEKLGFVLTHPQTYLSARIHADMNSEFREMKNWYFSMGDSDVF